MFEFLNPLREMTALSVLLRVVIATACGALIGMERSAKNRPAGIRTHILVCFGSALAAIVGQYVYLVLKMPADITRISAQVITGLGFIGAGTIIITKKRTIKGLTTAAGLWVTGIVGITIGSGYFEGGIIGAVLILLTETVFGLLHGNIRRNLEYALELGYKNKNDLDDILRMCKDNRMSITNLRIQSGGNGTESGEYTAVISLRGATKSDYLITIIETMGGVTSVEEL